MLNKAFAASNMTIAACHQKSRTKRVLRYVNKIRADFGLKPVRYLATGHTGHSESCSIALTLLTKYTHAEVNGTTIDVSRYSRVKNQRGNEIQSKSYDVPTYVTEWISSFDEGNYPGLIKARKAEAATV